MGLGEMSKSKVYEIALSLLSDDKNGAKLKELLARIIEWEKAHPQKSEYDGFYWYDVSGDPRVLNKLVICGLLKVVMKTNSGTAYRLVDLQEAEKALESFGEDAAIDKSTEEEVKIPDDLLDIIIGHEEKKEIIMRALKADDRVHLLLYGSPASAKSLILECLQKIARSKYIIGSASTKAGLFELLYNEEPSFLILDEIDKMESMEDLSILLSMMQSGFISETKHYRRRTKMLNTKVIAAANRIDRLPPELLSRFVKLRFSNYTDDEFVDVAAKVLQREGIPINLAGYIADQVLNKLGSRDVRDAIKCARLLREETKEDVDKVIDLLRQQL